MIISDLYVGWFPLLFGLFFLVSFLVDEIRKRGHLRLGRDPKKGEVIGILVILGFNLIVAGPIIIVGLLIEYSVGAPPTMVLLMSMVMALAELIPIFLSGIFAYLLIKVLYQRWGVSLTVFFATGILILLTGLDAIGWLRPAMPFIIDMLSTLIMTQFEFLIMFILLAACLGRCTTCEPPGGTESQKKQEMDSPSMESALQLLVGLSRRIVNDGDEKALEALGAIYNTNQYSKKILGLAGREVQIELGNILSRKDLSYFQQALDFANGRFGKLKKWVRDAIAMSMFFALVSGILVVFFVSIGFLQGLFLMMLTIMLPILSGLGYQQTARYEAGRYAPPAVSQFNSYLLTQTELKSRIFRERMIFGVSFMILGGILGASLVGTLSVELVWGIISALVIVLGGGLSTRDRMLSPKQLEFSEVVERGLLFMGVKIEKVSEDESSNIEQPAAPIEIMESIPEVTEDWQQQLEMRGHHEFAQKVITRAREVYVEHVAILFYMGIGGIMVFMGVITFYMFSTFTFLFGLAILPISFMAVGTPLFLFGVYKYLGTRNLTRLRGLTRKNLTVLITHLDMKSQGIDSFGSITDMQAPSEYLGFEIVKVIMHTFTRASIVRLKNRIPWPKEEIEKAWKTRSSYPKLEGLGALVSIIVTILLYLYFPTPQNDSFLYIFKLILVGTVGFLVPTMFYAIIVYYHEKHVLTEIVSSTEVKDEVTYNDTLNSLFELLKSEFAMPLRMLLIGNYPQVAYTGRSYFTTHGFELREAVTIPQGAVIDLS